MDRNDTGRQPRDPEHVDVDDVQECAYWSEKLGVDVGELKSAVFHAGNRIGDVRRFLEERDARAESAPPPSMRDS